MPDSAVQEQPTTGQPTTDTPPAAAETQQLQPAAKLSASIGFGMSAQNWLEGFKIAAELAKSALVPSAFQGKPQDIVVAMQLGAEIGLAPMQALQSIAVINGKPGVYGDGFLAVIKGSPLCVGHQEWWEVKGERVARVRITDLEDANTTAVCAFWRRGQADPYVNAFSVGDAKKSGLWGKGGNWSTYPQRMMMWRARSWAGRDAFPDVLRGIGMVEELQDHDREAPQISVSAIPAAPAEPIRRSEKAAAAAVAEESLPETPSSGAANPPPPSAEPAKPAGAAKTAKAQQTAPGQVTKNVSILETAYVAKPKNGSPAYHEIKGVVFENGHAGMGFTWITRDEQLAKMAESCAGSNALFTITWYAESIADKSAKDVKVLTGLQAAN